MTREEKIKFKKERAHRRKHKRHLKDKSYLNTALTDGTYGQGISWGRRKQKGLIFTCEMGWGSCEERGYCDGDC